MALIRRKSIEAAEARRGSVLHRLRSRELDRQIELERMAEGETGQEAQRSMGRGSTRYNDLPPVTFSEQGGVRFLHFGTDWVQGAMRLAQPDWPELEYIQQMMAWMLCVDWRQEDLHIVQLGLGAAAATKCCYRQFPQARVTAIELNPAVITAARSMLALPDNDERLSVQEGDAWNFVMDADNAASVHALQVDLYDAAARGPVLDSLAFYRACRRVLQPTATAPAVMTINLFGDETSFPRNIERICEAFDNRVLVFPEVHDGNVIALAFTGPIWTASWDEIYARAEHIEEDWVRALREANIRQEERLAI
jgi:spermidine synthase